MSRGEVWTAAGSPIEIVQDDRFAETAPITICAFTSDPTNAPILRLAAQQSGTNGLEVTSRLMVDKTTTVPRGRLGHRIGRLDDEDMLRVNRAILVFLGLAG